MFSLIIQEVVCMSTWRIIAILITAWLLYHVVTAVCDPLRSLPGPFMARFTRLWLFRQYCGGNYVWTNIELHKKHGPIVRIAPGQYSLDNPEAAKIIYGHGTQFVKASWYLPWGDPVDRNLFNEIDPKVHGIMRRQVSNVYTMSNMVSYEPYVDECTEILCQRLIEFSASNVPINMARWFQYYAFDMIGKITFSKRFGCLDAGKDHRDIIKALDDSAQLASALGLYPLIFHYLLKIFKCLSKDQDAKGPAYIAQYAEEQVAARQIEKQRDDKPQDFVAKLLEGQKERPDTVTDHAIRLSSGANIAAGSDTTAITLSNILYNLCKHPAIMHKLRQELGDARASGHISNPITFREAQGLPYLQAVIKEGLRRHPAVGFTMPRVVPKGGKRLAGRFFPEGTIVGINPWVAHRNTDVFRQDADEFRPERWLSSSQQTIEKKEMEAYFMAFGLGSRTCIGKNISLLEVSKALPRLVMEFDFNFEKPGKWSSVNYWFVKPTDFYCYITRRQT